MESVPPPRDRECSLAPLWRAHGILHKTWNLLIPAVLLGLSVAMAMYQHFSNNDTGDYSTRNFLILIILSMAPLAVLEKKLMECTDPIGVISKFSPKILLMHAGFLFIRFVAGCCFDFQTRFFKVRSIVCLVMAATLIPTVFRLRPTRRDVLAHLDVAALAAVAVLTAVITEYVDAYAKGLLANSWLPRWYRHRLAMFVCSASSDYMEILAFVPAMWMVCRDHKSASLEGADVGDTQKRALALFVFILTFYTGEDLHSAFALGWDFKFAAGGHIAHFLLLLDFAAYILSHLYDPTKCEKLMHKLWSLISDSSAV